MSVPDPDPKPSPACATDPFFDKRVRSWLWRVSGMLDAMAAMNANLAGHTENVVPETCFWDSFGAIQRAIKAAKAETEKLTAEYQARIDAADAGAKPNPSSRLCLPGRWFAVWSEGSDGEEKQFQTEHEAWEQVIQWAGNMLGDGDFEETPWAGTVREAIARRDRQGVADGVNGYLRASRPDGLGAVRVEHRPDP